MSYIVSWRLEKLTTFIYLSSTVIISNHHLSKLTHTINQKQGTYTDTDTSSHVFPCLPMSSLRLPIAWHSSNRYLPSDAAPRSGPAEVPGPTAGSRSACPEPSRGSSSEGSSLWPGWRWWHHKILEKKTWEKMEGVVDPDFMGIRLHEYLRKWLGMVGVKPI